MKSWQMKLLIAASLAYFCIATVLISLTLTLSYRSETAVNSLIISGKTPGAIKTTQAASVDLQLLCIVLQRSLKTPLSASDKMKVHKDCSQ